MQVLPKAQQVLLQFVEASLGQLLQVAAESVTTTDPELAEAEAILRGLRMAVAKPSERCMVATVSCP